MAADVGHRAEGARAPGNASLRYFVRGEIDLGAAPVQGWLRWGTHEPSFTGKAEVARQKDFAEEIAEWASLPEAFP